MLPYRDFYYPLNVFMHVLTAEEGGVKYLHYGLFDRPDDSIEAAQERSTELLLARLPKPPCSILEVGIGLGTTLARLTRLGYDAIGITPDDKQIAFARQTFGNAIRIEHVAYEHMTSRRFDVLVFQESSQYIPSDVLFAKAREMTTRIVVMDEFAAKPGGTLHSLDEFKREAARNGFTITEELDLSQRAAPTVDYFMARLDRFRSTLIADLGLTNEQVDELIASGRNYRQLYANGTYVYRLLTLQEGTKIVS